MDVASLITGLFKPAADLIDNLHTSEEERMQAQTAQMGVQLQIAMRFLQYETDILKAQSSIVLAEAQGGGIKSWWRPITMLVFLFLVVLDSFGWLPFRLADQAWTLLQIGLGGYVVGRSAEKVVPKLLAGKNGA